MPSSKPLRKPWFIRISADDFTLLGFLRVTIILNACSAVKGFLKTLATVSRSWVTELNFIIVNQEGKHFVVGMTSERVEINQVLIIPPVPFAGKNTSLDPK